MLSDELVWAYSRLAGGPLPPSNYSIQLPQSTVQKSASFLLENIIHSERDVNYGDKLPGGFSLFNLLVDLADEEQQQLKNRREKLHAQRERREIEMTQLTRKSNQSRRSLHQYSLDHTSLRRLSMAIANNSMDEGHSRRNLLPGGSAAATSGSLNTLVRVLLRIPEYEIKRLQAGVHAVADAYKFYAFNSSLSVDSKPPPAYHTFPTGGAIDYFEAELQKRKEMGIKNMFQSCQVNRDFLREIS